MNNRDFYAPTGEKIVGTYRVWHDNEMEYPYLLKLHRGWDHPKLYSDALEWMVSTDVSKVAESRGITYLNNLRYFDTIQFKTAEDRLVFALRFSEICDRGFYK